jgi:hypothetical protein
MYAGAQEKYSGAHPYCKYNLCSILAYSRSSENDQSGVE